MKTYKKLFHTSGCDRVNSLDSWEQFKQEISLQKNSSSYIREKFTLKSHIEARHEMWRKDKKSCLWFSRNMKNFHRSLTRRLRQPLIMKCLWMIQKSEKIGQTRLCNDLTYHVIFNFRPLLINWTCTAHSTSLKYCLTTESSRARENAQHQSDDDIWGKGLSVSPTFANMMYPLTLLLGVHESNLESICTIAHTMFTSFLGFFGCWNSRRKRCNYKYKGLPTECREVNVDKKWDFHF